VLLLAARRPPHADRTGAKQSFSITLAA
jgi:hypothetical protein